MSSSSVILKHLSACQSISSADRRILCPSASNSIHSIVHHIIGNLGYLLVNDDGSESFVLKKKIKLCTSLYKLGRVTKFQSHILQLRSNKACIMCQTVARGRRAGELHFSADVLFLPINPRYSVQAQLGLVVYNQSFEQSPPHVSHLVMSHSLMI